MNKSLIIFILIFTLLNFNAVTQEKIIKKCPSCGFVEKREEAKFCIHCGTKLKVSATVPIFMCPKCNKPLDKKGKFCAFCGSKGELKYIEVPQNPEDFNPLKKIEKKITHKEPKIKKEKFKIENLFFPKSNYLEKHAVKRKTETIKKVLTICKLTPNEFISFYKTIFKTKAKIIRVGHLFSIFEIIRIKFKGYKDLEIVLYSVQETPGSELWEKGLKQINKRFSEQMKPIEKINNEINTLNKWVMEGRITKSSIESHVLNLERKKNIIMNSPSYWDLWCMKKVTELNKDIILFNHTIKERNMDY